MFKCFVNLRHLEIFRDGFDVVSGAEFEHFRHDIQTSLAIYSPRMLLLFHS
ncbi:MAG: hypothetical protein M3388_18880 [Acidobacteriota bacterium]|nr:hypothetical protein [Acidobacteriota bacterium]